MPKCKYCDKTISKDDYDLCPYCGGKNPIDPDYKTQNITQVILTKGNQDLYKSKKKKTAVLLSCLLGPFGATFFYIKEMKKAIICLVTTLILLAVGIVLSVLVWPYTVIFPIVILWAAHISYGVYIAKSHAFRDGEGEYLH